MSLSVKSSLAEAMDWRTGLRGRPWAWRCGRVAVDALDDARNLLGAVDGLGELEPRLVARPSRHSPCGGSAAGRCPGELTFEPIAALDRVAALGFQRRESPTACATGRRNRRSSAGACRAARPSPAASGRTCRRSSPRARGRSPGPSTSGSISLRHGGGIGSRMSLRKIKTASSRPRGPGTSLSISSDVEEWPRYRRVRAARKRVSDSGASALFSARMRTHRTIGVQEAEEGSASPAGRRPGAAPRSRATTIR